jgi:hypothetical protein
LTVLKDLAANDIEDCRVAAIAKRLRRPWRTIRRTLEALYVLDMVHIIEDDDEEEEDAEENSSKADRKTPRYSLAADVNLNALGRA